MEWVTRVARVLSALDPTGLAYRAYEQRLLADLTPDKKPLADLGWFPFPAVDGGKGDPAAMMGGVDGYSCSAKAPAEAKPVPAKNVAPLNGAADKPAAAQPAKQG